MGRIVLITGGSRSGKSAHAQQLAEGEPGSHTFVATCPPIDEEMRERIRRHREDREGRGWSTVEETLDLVGAIRRIPDGGVLLVDCLTLWINNLMYRSEQDGREVGEDEMVELAQELVGVATEREGMTLFVTNELGIGIVPEHAMVRRYRDLVGRCNQAIASGAGQVVLMVAGIPMELKPG